MGIGRKKKWIDLSPYYGLCRMVRVCGVGVLWAFVRDHVSGMSDWVLALCEFC